MKCLKRKKIGDEAGYELVVIRAEDMESIRQWRNAQVDVLRQKGEITSSDQKAYFTQIIQPTFTQEKPTLILFSFLHQGKCIGYGGLTNVNWANQRAEISFLVDTARIKIYYQEDYTHFLKLLCRLAFDDLKFHRLFTETFDFRKEHMAILESVGFRREGLLREHVFKQNRWCDSVMHGLLAKEYSNGV